MKNRLADPDLSAVVREKLIPLSPIPTGEEPREDPVPEIRAILFDVYGTLVISGTGDIGGASSGSDGPGVESVFVEAGFKIRPKGLEAAVTEGLEAAIKKRHGELIREGVDYPEVEIRDIWIDLLVKLWREGFLHDDPRGRSVEEVALRYELNFNPVWPMPGFPEIVRELSGAGYPVGIVSNAQFYTPVVIEAVVGEDLGGLGFRPELCAWSYSLSRSKPSPTVFNGPLSALQSQGIKRGEVLYVGNDMLNDVTAANRAGCRTCLFAGDKRSLRLREGDSRANAEPDMVITDLYALGRFKS